MSSDFLLEKKLKETRTDLHQNARDAVVVLEKLLDTTLIRFPEFTDHTILHSMEVLDYCNRIIGEKQLRTLCPEEMYVLIMACYFHDIGMGISDKDYEEFSQDIDFGDWLRDHPDRDDASILRRYHNEYSGRFIIKYAELFDIPSEDLTRAITQVAKGHRIVDLFDEEEYPNIKTRGGIIRTPYLAAVLRLADEIDVASDRNPELLFGSIEINDKKCIVAHALHRSIKRVEVTEDVITLDIHSVASEYREDMADLIEKIRQTLDYSRSVAEERSDLRITQNKVVVKSI